MAGPCEVSAAEAYADATAAPPSITRAWTRSSRSHVDGDGLVDYEGLARDSAALDAYLASLATAPFAELGRDEKLALLINAYNAFTLRLILDHRPVASIKTSPPGSGGTTGGGSWRARR